MKLAIATLVAVVALGTSTRPARADLLGHVMTADYIAPIIGTVAYAGGTATVGAGVEFPGLDGVFDVNISSGQIVFDGFQLATTFSSLPQNGPELTDTTAPWGAVSIDDSTNMVGFDASRLFVSGNTLRINWAGLPFDGNTRVVLDVAVPEPASIGLLAVGLIGISAFRRRSTV